MSRADPAFGFDSAPIPLPPFPAGRGEPKVYFAGGFAPGTPALNRLRHLQTLRIGARAGGFLQPGFLPPQRVPTHHLKAERTGFPQAMPVPRPTQPGDARGEAPCIRKPLVSFFPAALAIPAPGERTISNAAVALATDSSISPGPPSPWLPALLKGKPFCRFYIKP